MKKANQFDASSSMAGYLYQCRLALLLGLQRVKRNPNGHISIEKFDDISFDDDDLGKCLIQAKHHVTPKSLTDKSTELWKTLRIWIEEFSSGNGLSNSKSFFLITTATAQSKSAVEKLRLGRTDGEIKEAFQLLRNAAESSDSKTTEIGRGLFLSMEEQTALNFLSCITILDSHPDLSDCRDEIEGELRIFSPDHIESLVEHVEGWWFNVVAEKLLGHGNALIPLQNIQKKVHEIGKVFLADELPVDDSDTLTHEEYSVDDENRTFVKQLRLVETHERSIKRAVHDFYRSRAQRSKWARENLLLDGESARYDKTLADHWERKFDADLTEHDPKTENEKRAFGRRLGAWASMSQIPFRNVVEVWITAGSLHSLADRSLIGWHPDFLEHFAEKKVSEDA